MEQTGNTREITVSYYAVDCERLLDHEQVANALGIPPREVGRRKIKLVQLTEAEIADFERDPKFLSAEFLDSDFTRLRATVDLFQVAEKGFLGIDFDSSVRTSPNFQIISTKLQVYHHIIIADFL